MLVSTSETDLCVYGEWGGEMKKEYIAGREYVSCTGFSLGNCGGGREWRLGCGAAAVGEGERDEEYAYDACRQPALDLF